MTTVIGDEDNGWSSATMVNGKMIEQDTKNVADGFNVPKPSLEELNANYPYPFKPHDCTESACSIESYILVGADTPDAKLVPRYADGTVGPPTSTTGCSGDYPKWAPPVDHAGPVHSGLIYGPSPKLTPEEARRLLDEGNRLVDQLTAKAKRMQIHSVDESDSVKPSVTSTSPKSLDSSHKIPVNLCPASAIIAIALVIAQGHKKPGRTIYNWRDKSQKISYMDYHAAAQRHLIKSIDGSDFDKELSDLAGVPVRHDWAAMSCLAIIEDARQAGTLVDDRPVKGGAEEFLESLMVKK